MPARVTTGSCSDWQTINASSSSGWITVLTHTGPDDGLFIAEVGRA